MFTKSLPRTPGQRYSLTSLTSLTSSLTALVLAAVLSLTGCGGGGGSSEPPDQAPGAGGGVVVTPPVTPPPVVTPPVIPPVAEVTKTFNIVVTDRDARVYYLSDNMAVPVINGTGLAVIFDCYLPKANVGRIEGMCATLDVSPSVRFKFVVDPTTWIMTVDGSRPGEVGFEQPDNSLYAASLDNFDVAKGWEMSLETFDSFDGVPVTYFVTSANKPDIMRLKNGVITTVRDGTDWQVDGIARNFKAYTFKVPQ